jgi:hypothetical protein
MKTSKRIFLVGTVVFILAMVGVGYDISRRTTFPGSKPQLKERLLNSENQKDSARISPDSLKQLDVH